MHLLKDGWLHTFVSQPGHEGHSLVDSSSNYINIKLTFDEASGKWKLPENAKQHDVTIKVKCTSEIPEPDESIISQLKVALNCVNVTDGSHNDTSELSTYTTGYYTCEVDKVNRTATVSITEDQAKYWINNNINTMVGKEQHSFIDVSEAIVLTYTDNKWNVPADSKFTINMLCGPTDKDLQDATVIVDCINANVNHQSFPFALISGTYEFGDVYSIENTYFCDVTVHSNQYVAAYNDKHYPNHNTSEDQAFILKFEDGTWKLQEK